MKWPYARDPLCLGACACYAGNRWLLPAVLKGAFLRGHFSDLLFIPAALPPMLWLHRRLGLRDSDRPPTWPEIAFHFVVWSIVAEVIAPHVFARSTGDAWDVLAYALGALAAGLIWRRA